MLLSLAFQTHAQDAIYIYRNDGNFNAYLIEEVDSIVYSKYDTDSISHTDWSSCVVYCIDGETTAIPLEVIDSISFSAPQTIYCSDVIRLNEMREYISHQDNMTLYVNSDIPSSHYPKIGSVLLIEEFSEEFPMGFSGKVKSITQEGNLLTCICDSARFDDIYEQIIVVGEYLAVEDDSIQETSRTRLVPKRVSGSGSVAKSLKLEGHIGSKSSPVFVDASASAAVTTKLVLKKEIGKPFFSDLSVRVELGFDVDAGLEVKSSEKWESKKVTLLSVPIPNLPSVYFQFSSGVFAELQGKASITAGLHGKAGALFGVKYVNDEIIPYKKPIYTPQDKIADFSVKLSGSLFVGFENKAGIYAVGKILACTSTTKTGFEIKSDLDIDLLDLYSNGNGYDVLKDISVDAAIKVVSSAEITYNIIYPKDFVSAELINIKFPVNSWKIFPTFDVPELRPSAKGILTASVSPSEKLLFPVNIGIAVYDKQMTCVDYEYCSSQYRVPENWPYEKYQVNFTGLTPGLEYTVYPLVKIFGAEIKASPNNIVSVPVEIQTLDAEDISYDTAVLFGYVEGTEDVYDFAETGFFYSSTHSIPNAENSSSFAISAKSMSGKFQQVVENLSESTTYYYRAYVKFSDTYYYGSVKSFKTKEKPKDAVDLGLSVLWAKWNVGANSESELGGLYGWADPTGTNTAYNVLNEGGTKWVSSLYGGSTPPNSISGTSLDVATAKWGGEWRLPTEAEMVELIDNCTWEWTVSNGTAGMTVTGPNGNSIFLPAGGDRFGTERREYGEYGYYWTGTLNTEETRNAYRLEFDDWGANYTSYARYIGHLVRPVMNKPQ